MIFIKLTLWKSLEEIYVCPDKFREIKSHKDKYTVLIYSDTDQSFVKETPREILDLIDIERDLQRALDNLKT